MGKAAGPEDKLNAEVHKSLKTFISPVLAKIFNCVIKTGKIPPIWRQGAIVNLFKTVVVEQKWETIVVSCYYQ